MGSTQALVLGGGNGGGATAEASAEVGRIAKAVGKMARRRWLERWEVDIEMGQVGTCWERVDRDVDKKH